MNDARPTRARIRRTALAVVVAMAALAGCALNDDRLPAGPDGGPSAGESGPEWDPQPLGGAYDPADYAGAAVTHCGEAGVDPVLMVAILYNESYKPHDPDLERFWLETDPGASLGIANMHRAAFDDTKRGRDFADRDWTELPDDRDLAVRAACWYLHDLGGSLPESWTADYDENELLAMGYNAGPGSMAGYAGGATPAASVRDYLDRLHGNWDDAETAVAAVG